jgi:PAS domain S-box-containing protein
MSAGMPGVELLIQTALLGEAVDAGPALVFVADEHMRYIAVNRAACEALGYEREELLQLHVIDVAREADAPTEYGEMLLTGSRAGAALLTRKDGVTVNFLYQAAQATVAGMPLYVSIGFVYD